MSLRLRAAGSGDIPLLKALLYEAAFWRPSGEKPPRAEALAAPELAVYVEGFGRHGDFGLIAEVDLEPVGAGWWRHMRTGNAGYGFVDEETPELSIAVLEAHRGKGLGTALLEGLLRESRHQGIDRLSLSVERDNPAVVLYERVGFRAIEDAGGALTMVVDLRD